MFKNEISNVKYLPVEPLLFVGISFIYGSFISVADFRGSFPVTPGLLSS